MTVVGEGDVLAGGCTAEWVMACEGRQNREGKKRREEKKKRKREERRETLGVAGYRESIRERRKHAS